MTGFGRASVERAGLRCDVEIRSVNHRFLDLKLRLPRALAPSEPQINRRLAQRLRRGRVEITAQLTSTSQAEDAVEVDLGKAQALVAVHRRLAEALGVALALDTTTVAAWPGVLNAVTVEQDPQQQLDLFHAALDAAEVALLKMRREEGAALAADVRAHLDALAALRGAVAAAAAARSQAYQARLLARLRETLSLLDVEIDTTRVLQEVALFAEKTDIAEELARLESHHQQALSLLSVEEEAVGRRLDFLCQEMFREVNTIGSKAQDMRVAEHVIEMKAELERLREQVQNVE
ncbi:YicC family protein [Myxococcota bacterium]|nr:YicC family protein [Myxococcota bacterium]